MIRPIGIVVLIDCAFSAVFLINTKSILELSLPNSCKVTNLFDLGVPNVKSSKSICGHNNFLQMFHLDYAIALCPLFRPIHVTLALNTKETIN